MKTDVNVLALVRGDQKYIFFYGEGQRAELERTLGRWAANPDLQFNWFDAAQLTARAREQAREAARTDDTRGVSSPEPDH